MNSVLKSARIHPFKGTTDRQGKRNAMSRLDKFRNIEDRKTIWEYRNRNNHNHV